MQHVHLPTQFIAFAIGQGVFERPFVQVNRDDNCGADRTACPASYDFMSDRAREERSFGLFLGFGAGGIVALGAAAIGLF